MAAKKDDRVLLNGVSGLVCGGLCAVMVSDAGMRTNSWKLIWRNSITPTLWVCVLPCVQGPSGSGKSTLLNALALRLDPKVAITGEQRLNGKPYTTGGCL